MFCFRYMCIILVLNHNGTMMVKLQKKTSFINVAGDDGNDRLERK